MKNSPWQDRVKVSHASTELLFQLVDSQWGATIIGLRRKLTKQQLEEKAEVCALACPLI